MAMNASSPLGHPGQSRHQGNGKGRGADGASGFSGEAAPPGARAGGAGGGKRSKSGGPDVPSLGLTDRTDEQLLDDYRHGEKASFSELVGRYQRELYHFLVRFLGNRAAAEDVFQETFLQVHQSAEQFDPQRRFRPWLFTIAANKARDLIRSQARRPANPLQAS